MEQLTVFELLQDCIKEINKGNGNKHIYVPTDDEGNQVRPIYFSFTDDKQELETWRDTAYFALTNEDKMSDIIVLG